MYAIVEIGGHQFKVEAGQEVFVNRLEGDEGDKIVLDKVLLIDNEGKILTGTPKIEGAGITAKLVEHLKGDKVLVFKKKRRKGYKVLNGHRQYLSKLLIEKIEEKGVKAPAAKKAVAKAQADDKVKAEEAPAKEVKAAAEAKAPKAKAETAEKPAAKTEAKPKAAAKPKAEKKTEDKPAEEKDTNKED